jgi:hypothetical protein
VNAFKLQEYYVQQRITELCNAALTVIELERELQLTHTGRNHYRYVLEDIFKTIKKTAEPSEILDVNRIPF